MNKRQIYKELDILGQLMEDNCDDEKVYNQYSKEYKNLKKKLKQK